MARKPDLIVGIDVGMTATGVGYSYLSDLGAPVKYIQKWPGRGGANENKVPTVLVYEGQRLSSWGFSAGTQEEISHPHKKTREWFKIFLDPDQLEREREEQRKSNDPDEVPTIRQVKSFYKDFLVNLYGHIKENLENNLGMNWYDAHIEFIFSVPTTWNHATIESFRQIIYSSGYLSPNHKVDVGLTEAEAAAVFTSRDLSRRFNDGDTLLICDAGGGTTDLSVLKVSGTKGEKLSLQQLDPVFGDNVGSAAIDVDFEDLATHKLSIAHRRAALHQRPRDIAWEMMKHPDFQNLKCDYGKKQADFPFYSIPIPHLAPNYVNNAAGIADRTLRVSKVEFQHLFDQQLRKIYTLIDSQLDGLAQRQPNVQVAYLVLSGGLGDNKYVQRQLIGRYCTEGGQRHRSAMTMKLLVADDPQLAVCKGLVVDRVQKLKEGTSVLAWRCCRQSYGMLCKEKYDKRRHVGREIWRDPDSGKTYANNCIEWFVRKGDPVSNDSPIVRPFRRRVYPGDPRRVFPSSIITSTVDKIHLQEYMTPASQVCCQVESDLSGADESKFLKKNRHFWNRGKKHFQVNFQVKVIIGPADLRFEVWFAGQKMSKDNSIKVDWITTAAPKPTMQSWDGGDERLRN